MSVDTNVVGYPIGRSANAGILFSVALILATVIPFFGIASAPAHPSLVPAVAFVLLLGSTHVAATFYLLTDAAIRRFCRDYPIRMIVIPCALLAAGMMLFAPGSPVFVPAVLLFFLWQSWHFGAQNIGVATFVSMNDRGRPLGRGEKMAIRAGVIVGMLGVLKVMAPGYMIGAQYMPLSALETRVIDLFYQLGLVACVPLTGLALWLAVRSWLKQQYLFGISLFLAATFLFPMYLAGDYTLGFLSFAGAHGLQYLVFLFAHSIGRGREIFARRQFSAAVIAAPVALLLFMGAGRLIWGGAFTDQSSPTVPIAVPIVLSLILIHFWVDQFLWRMKNKERADWMKSRFGYVLPRLPVPAGRATAP